MDFIEAIFAAIGFLAITGIWKVWHSPQDALWLSNYLYARSIAKAEADEVYARRFAELREKAKAVEATDVR